MDVDTTTTTTTTTTHLTTLSTMDTASSNLIDYIGIVTRVIDHFFGIYELNNQVILCLFHHIGVTETCPYLVGTRLVISHVHRLAIVSNVDKSLLLDMQWKIPKVDLDDENNKDGSTRLSARCVLVACMRSDVRIDRFIDDDSNNIVHLDHYIDTTMDDESKDTTLSDNPDELSASSLFGATLRRMIYAHCIGRHLNFPAMIRQLELFASIQIKFANLLNLKNQSGSDDDGVSLQMWVGKQLIETVFSTTGNRSTHQQGDLYGDFFQHGQSCLAVDEVTNGSSKVVLDECPSLQQLVSTILDNDIDDMGYKLNISPLIEVPPSFITSHPGVTRYYYDAKTKDIAWVIGVVDCLPDGELYFMDDTYKIKLLLTGTGRHDQASTRLSTMSNVILGNIYLIKRFQLVVERISFTGMSTTLEHKYMMCNYQDMKQIAAIPHSLPVSVINNTRLCLSQPINDKDKIRLASFFVEKGGGILELGITIHYVMEMQPTTMKIWPDGTIGLERWIRTIQFELKQDAYGQQGNDKPLVTTLVFTSRLDSLSYVSQLEIGSLFGLTTMEVISPSTVSNDMTATEVESTEAKEPTYFVDSAVHRFYPIDFLYHQQQQRQQRQQQQKQYYQQHILHIRPVLIDSEMTNDHVGNASNGSIWKKALIPILDIADAIRPMETSDEQQQQEEEDDISKDTRTAKKYDGSGNIHGIVLFKGFLTDDTSISSDASNDRLGEDSMDIQLAERLGIGLGRRGLKYFLRLRQVDGLETTDVYIGGKGIHQVQYTIGVIPGNLVTLYNVDRRQAISSGKVYYAGTRRTYIQAHAQIDPIRYKELFAITNTMGYPTRSLCKLLPCDNKKNDIGADEGQVNGIFKAVVTIRRILKVQLQWVCTECNSAVSQEKCSKGCNNNSRYLFKAEAKVEVSDGTADATAMIDGEALVFRLLMLLPSQQEALKKAAMNHGTLSSGLWIHGFKTGKQPLDITSIALKNGMTLDDICTRARRYGRYCLYGRQYYHPKYRTTTTDDDMASSSLKALQLRMITLSHQDESVTLAFPYTRIKVEAIEHVATEQHAWHLLDQLLS
ncbi:CST, telomere maintenance, complex subunit CTC1-domain-containing protein [Halteromyces radiatus]|uniref:CST, telomere maintenance, complex subunit CTC1-domain-containing protein n=1 Tax=Halteromyces radiatus TaxID=101107 RepID=UPI00221E386B|nr:CST, telomere maintenance, complex subunit CTC1-domain-containing protein [Halteromyces radiatus]KAI8093626.1 CST, telomere maintenance, complex subunit CTC1-domain-containing protein [Halteromyces radiatus]